VPTLLGDQFGCHLPRVRHRRSILSPQAHGGPGKPGWKWLDLRRLAEAVVAAHSSWSGAQVTRVINCTAPIDGLSNVSGARNQNVYLRALRATEPTDKIEKGRYISKVISRPLAVKGPTGNP
jgi:hypothetical protein